MFKLICREGELDLGPSLELIRSFGEMERAAGGEQYPNLFYVPWTDEEPVTDDQFEAMQAEACQFVERHPNVGDHAAWILRRIADADGGKKGISSSIRGIFGFPVAGREIRKMFSVAKQFDEGDIDDIIEAFEVMSVSTYVDKLTDAYLAAMKARIDDAEEEVGVSIGFDVKSPLAIEYARDQAGGLITGINDTTRDAIRDVLSKGIAEGKSMRNLADDIEEVFSVAKGSRAMVIARTETAEAMTWAAEESYKSAGVEKKEWLLAPDYDPAEDDGACEDYDGEMVDVGEDFHDGVDGPPLHVNCKCAIAPILREEMEDAGEEKGVDLVKVTYVSKYATKESRQARRTALGQLFAPAERNFRNRVIRLFQGQRDVVLKKMRRMA